MYHVFMGEEKIKSFTDLNAWKKSYQLLLEIYKITKQFPKEELYCLVSQIRRSALSVVSNIAEGFSRRGEKDKRQFYYISLGSLTELQTQLLLTKDLSYITKQQFTCLAQLTITIHKLINGLIKSCKSHNT